MFIWQRLALVDGHRKADMQPRNPLFNLLLLIFLYVAEKNLQSNTVQEMNVVQSKFQVKSLTT